MTKKEIIKQTLMGSIKTYAGEYDNGMGMNIKNSVFQDITVVDLDKLAEFLAKHIELKAEDLITN